MKRNISILMIVAVISGAAGCSTVSASDENTVEIAQTVTGDATMVDAEAAFNELGYDINMESTSKTLYASRKKNVVAITAGSDIAVLNGENIKMNSEAKLDESVISVTAASMEVFTGEEINSDGSIVTEEETTDESWKKNTVSVDLSGVSDDIYTITGAGVYTLTGDYNGMIYVNSEGRVKLILNGVNITNENGPAIYFENSDKGIIESAKGTENNLTDGSEYSVDAKGCIFSNDDIDFKGTGVINVNGNYKHGIASDDDIQIEEGTINVTTAAGDGIHANDGVEIKSGTITIDSMEDGISGDKYVEIDDGTVNIVTRGEIDESTDNDMPDMHGGGFGGQRPERQQSEMPQMEEGSGPADMGEKNEIPESDPPADMGERPERPEGGTQNAPGERPAGDPPLNDRGERPTDNPSVNETAETNTEQATEGTTEESISSKGIKSDNLITLNGGNISVSSTDHCIKSDNLVVINAGRISLKSDISKGIKALGCIFINEGSIDIDTKDEGIESKATVTINGGDIDIKSQEDGINAGGGSGAQMMGNVSDGDEHQIIINGGNVSVDATQDGLDSNGNLYIYGGEVLINGPSSGGDSALDCSGKNVIYGGRILALGSARMAECPESGGSQNILNITLDEVQKAGSTVVIMDSSNNALYEAVSAREFQSVIFSSEDIVTGEEYSVYINGEKTVSVTAESGVTQYGNAGMNRERGGMGDMRGRGGEPVSEQSEE